jgi:cytochrome c oxidase subunit II
VRDDTSRGGSGRPGRRLVRVVRLALLPVVALASTGCSGLAAKWTRGGWPEPITVQGHRVLGLWRGALVASIVVGAGMLVLIIGTAVFYRRRSPDQLPRQVRYNLPIEVLYTFIPIVIVSVLFYFTAIRESDEDKITPGGMQVGVVGFQWSWQFNYLQNGLSVTGRPGNDPQLVLPEGAKVHFYETSPDVIHSFWVIPFLFKRDVIPGRVNQFQITLDKGVTGTFKGKCTEYCGLDHDRMLFSVKIVSKQDYQRWLAQAKTAAANKTNPEYTVYTGPKQITGANSQSDTEQGSTA